MPGFVRTAGPRFSLDGRPFHATGVNCYFLGYCSQAARAAAMAEIRATGANVIRAWAFLDADGLAPGRPVFQYGSNGSISVNEGPDGLERLDALVACAGQEGIRLILPLVNYWPDFGGMRMYLRWLGIPGRRDAFYRSGMARDAYRNWVRSLLTRRNTLTGRLYLDEPAIMAWELANEPRWEGPGGRDLLLGWVDEMSAFVKALDANHLLAVGDEGQLCDDALAIPGIDFGTCHCYSPARQARDMGPAWIAEHLACGARRGKPMVLEEYGVEIDGAAVRSAAGRDAVYEIYLRSVRDNGGAGDLLWMLGSEHPEVAGFRDRYTILSAAEAPALRAHARACGVSP